MQTFLAALFIGVNLFVSHGVPRQSPPIQPAHSAPVIVDRVEGSRHKHHKHRAAPSQAPANVPGSRGPVSQSPLNT